MDVEDSGSILANAIRAQREINDIKSRKVRVDSNPVGVDHETNILDEVGLFLLHDIIISVYRRFEFYFKTSFASFQFIKNLIGQHTTGYLKHSFLDQNKAQLKWHQKTGKSCSKISYQSILTSLGMGGGQTSPRFL